MPPVAAAPPSPTRHAPAVLGCAAVILAAGAGVGLSTATVRQASGPAAARWVTTSFVLRAGVAGGEARRAVVIARDAAGALRLRETGQRRREETHVASGELRGSLSESAIRAGASPGLVAEAGRLFARTIDLARDIRPGDRFRLAFDRKVGADGRTVQTGRLLYAEIAARGRAIRFYRVDHDGRTAFMDGEGLRRRPLLLRTPVENARLTSGFGMRLHPLLGFNRLHPGIDFGAPVGTPVFAAGDGVVEEARFAGGYGNWLRLRHGEGFETGYGHLSRYAPGVRPGTRVRQGQVVAFVGSTGLSTGPHLHYEVLKAGRRIDPQGDGPQQAAALDAAELAAFRARKAQIDRLLGDREPAAWRAAAARAPRTGAAG